MNLIVFEGVELNDGELIVLRIYWKIFENV